MGGGSWWVTPLIQTFLGVIRPSGKSTPLARSQQIFRYMMQLCDLQQTGLWDTKAKVIYYSDVLIEAAILCSDLLYHFHMLVSFIMLLP